MKGYYIIDNIKIEDHITFLRINPTDIALTLRSVLDSLSDKCWISNFDEPYIRHSYEVKAQGTIDYIKGNIIKDSDDEITRESGEYVVSELARKTVVDELKYLDIPLAELFKIKDVKNHGFDFYSRNNDKILLFGEAKYLTGKNAYGKALEGIKYFIDMKKDSADISEIDRFCCEESKRNFHAGQKGYMAAFASKNTPTEQLIDSLKKNNDYQILSKYSELICIAVNV